MKQHGDYNEIIVDTLAVDDSSENNKKLMPEYIIYYQATSDMTLEDRKNDMNWHDALRAAKEFGVPIVIIDCEAIRQNELNKIKEGIHKDSTEYMDVKRLVGQIYHYKYRYTYKEKDNKKCEISKLISESKLDDKIDFLIKHKPEKHFDTSKYKTIDLKPKIAKNTDDLEGAGIIER